MTQAERLRFNYWLRTLGSRRMAVEDRRRKRPAPQPVEKFRFAEIQRFRRMMSGAA